MGAGIAAVGVAAALITLAATAQVVAGERVEVVGEYLALSAVVTVALAALALCSASVLAPAAADMAQATLGIPGLFAVAAPVFLAAAVPVMGYAAWVGRAEPGYLVHCAAGTSYAVAVTSTLVLYAG